MKWMQPILFCIDSTFFKAKLTRLRPGWVQLGKAKAKILASRPVWPRGLNLRPAYAAVMLRPLTSLAAYAPTLTAPVL